MKLFTTISFAFKIIYNKTTDKFEHFHRTAFVSFIVGISLYHHILCASMRSDKVKIYTFEIIFIVMFVLNSFETEFTRSERLTFNKLHPLISLRVLFYNYNESIMFQGC